MLVVPNSSLTQVNVENFTGAHKVTALISLNLYPAITPEKQALIRQGILDSTKDIFGIDSRSTEVTFQDFTGGEQNKTPAQITLCIVNYSEFSRGLQLQILSIASETLREKLKEYGVVFDIEEPTIDVDSSMVIESN